MATDSMVVEVEVEVEVEVVSFFHSSSVSSINWEIERR